MNIKNNHLEIFHWAASIWLHASIFLLLALACYDSIVDLDNISLETQKSMAEIAFSFFALSLGIVGLDYFILLVKGRRQNKWTWHKQLIVFFLIAIPCYGPFYFSKQIKSLGKSTDEKGKF